MKPADPFTVTVSVPPLPAEPGSYYYFVGTVFWKNPDKVPPFYPSNGARVLMMDTAALPIGLELSGAAYKNDEMTVTALVTKTVTMDESAAYLGIWYGWDRTVDFGAVRSDLWIPSAQVKAADRYLLAITDPRFAGDTQTVYIAIALKGAFNTMSTYILDSVRVGTPRPANDLQLNVDTVMDQGVALSWGAAERVRIWYGRRPIPRAAVILETEFQYVDPQAGAVAETLRTLNPETTYHFGLQVFRSGLWSTVTESSSAACTTLALPAGAVAPVNRLRLAGLTADEEARQILVRFSYDTAGAAWSAGLQAGVAYALEASGTYPQRDTGLQVVELAGSDTTIPLRLKESFQYNAVYLVNLWLRSAHTPWAAPTTAARGRVSTAGFSREPVVYLSAGDTIKKVFDGAVMLRWPRASGMGDGIADTLRVYQPPALPPGIVAVGPSFSFVNKRQSSPFDIGIRFDSLPAASKHRVAVYRDSSGVFTVEHGSVIADSAVWITTNDLSKPFLVCADTLPPTLTITTDTSAVLTPDTVVTVGFILNDNIANAVVKLAFGRGTGGYTHFFEDTLCAPSDTFLWLIDRNHIAPSHGAAGGALCRRWHTLRHHRPVTAHFYGCQRRHGDKSRLLDTAAHHGPTCPTEPVRLPLHADPIVRWHMWTYDIRKFRLFRWHSYSGNASDTLKWVEYADSLAQLFSLVPGQVLWLKTAERAYVRTGAAQSLSRVFQPGYNVIVWNGNTSTGESAAPGVYIVRMSVRQRGGNVLWGFLSVTLHGCCNMLYSTDDGVFDNVLKAVCRSTAQNMNNFYKYTTECI